MDYDTEYTVDGDYTGRMMSKTASAEQSAKEVQTAQRKADMEAFNYNTVVAMHKAISLTLKFGDNNSKFENDLKDMNVMLASITKYL